MKAGGRKAEAIRVKESLERMEHLDGKDSCLRIRDGRWRGTNTRSAQLLCQIVLQLFWRGQFHNGMASNCFND
jgi:hypothetical protein